jgi:hypothetical protein
VLVAIILITLPCYCLGAILLATAPKNDPEPTTITQRTPTLGANSSQLTPSATFGLIATMTPLGGPLRPTATQFYVRPTALVLPTWTFVFPTNAPFITSTPAPSFTPIIPTNTLAPTLTPTNTLAPSATPTTAEPPTATNTQEVPVEEPSPTQETGL